MNNLKKKCGLKEVGMDKIPPNNIEHLEAAQKELDKRRCAYLSSLPEEDQNKHKIIEECVQKLEQNKIYFLLLAAKDIKEDGFWQYNKLSYDITNPNEIQWSAANLTSSFFSLLSGICKGLYYMVSFQDEETKILHPLLIYHNTDQIHPTKNKE